MTAAVVALTWLVIIQPKNLFLPLPLWAAMLAVVAYCLTARAFQIVTKYPRRYERAWLVVAYVVCVAAATWAVVTSLATPVVVVPAFLAGAMAREIWRDFANQD